MSLIFRTTYRCSFLNSLAVSLSYQLVDESHYLATVDDAFELVRLNVLVDDVLTALASRTRNG